MFLDPTKPLETCTSRSCAHCGLPTEITCHFTAKDLAVFLVNAAPPFIIGGAGLIGLSTAWFYTWLGFIAVYFLFIEIRVLCSHCPHYAEPGATLRCWANYGMPKLWKYRPGPMNLVEKTVFLGGLILMFLVPLGALAFQQSWLLLLLLVLTSINGASLLKARFCSRCMNFACPLNNVSPDIRNQFMDINPLISIAWDQEP
jgi:hypothetical protein